MKYFKILLIPLITLMFMVPTKAEETPDWVYTEHYYLVHEHISSGTLTVHILSTKNNFRYRSNTDYRLYIPDTSVLEVHRKSASNNVWYDATNGSKSGSTFDDVFHRAIYSGTKASDFRLVFSNFDLIINGNLVFPKTPVANLAMVTQKAVETLEMEVQGTSGTISAVGGVILGLVLVPVLVSRLRRWAMP